MFRYRIVEQRPEQDSAFGVSDTPANDTTAIDGENDVEIEVAPLGWPHQLGDVPGPHFVRTLRQQLGLLINRVAELLTALANLIVLAEDTGTSCGSSSNRRLHRADWRKPWPAPDPRNAAHAADREPVVVVA
jgi:hypothetical protein